MAEVYASSVLGASAADIWSVVRDFNALPEWHPAIADSRIESAAPADQVGCVRAFKLRDGGFIREKLLALSDFDYSFSYSILESPMALTDYVATFKLTPITDGDKTFVEWSATFECAQEHEDELVTNIGAGVFQAGFDALKSRFGS